MALLFALLEQTVIITHGTSLVNLVPVSDPNYMLLNQFNHTFRDFPKRYKLICLSLGYGPYVDIWAPGAAIKSIYAPDDLALKTGTSMTAPMVAGTFRA